MKELSVRTLQFELYLKNNEATLEEFYSYLYETKKVKRWFDSFICWFTTSGDYFDENDSMYFHLLPCPFTYEIKCKELIPGNRGMHVELKGNLLGWGRFELIPDENGILLHHEMNFRAKNLFIHLYYSLLVSRGHNPYMKKRKEILRQCIIDEHKANSAK